MTLSDYKKKFEAELSAIYSASETTELFWIFAEKILDNPRMELRKDLGKNLEKQEAESFENYLSELKPGKPYQLILGETEFFGMKFLVNEHTLIPRPETEELVELAVSRMRNAGCGMHHQLTANKQQPTTILDIGTGSGIIPIILKKYFPEAEVTTMDFSAKALEIAKKNAALHHCNIQFIQADYLAHELSGTFDVIISNPPYIGIDEKPEIEDSVKRYEPENALFSPTEDPLIFYRKIAKDAKKHLAENGMVFLEINQKLGEETLNLFKNFPESTLLKDISGNDRFVVASNL